MDNKQLADFRQRLEESDAYYNNLVQEIDARGTLRDEVGELSVADNHPGDVGTEVFERSKDIGLRENALIQIDKIKEAKQKMAEGTYGLCERCGKEIPLERLQAVPQTTLCVNCKEHDEVFEAQQVRPVEEETLWPPFGRTFHDLTKDNAFDGEDAWQAVARYGTAESPSDVTEADDAVDTYIDSEEIIGAVEDTIEDVPYKNDPGRPNVFHYSTRHGQRK
ncbi:MAG TPA: TraR/DksA C4-type zinc finger protein [Desulfobacteria bacterium]|nr:TraR/DksA C4-type zinc finger protein [Desulfobacteria bacterium]